jgi:hypothetical protein
VVGIHWGGSDNDGIGHPIAAVFDDLRLTTVCGGLIEALIESVFSTEAETRESEKGSPTSGRFACMGPVYRRRKGTRFHVGIARDFEKRVKDSATGSIVLKMLRAYRTDVVNVLLDGDGWRAAVFALAPLLSGKVTTDEVLDHRFSKQDVRNFERLLQVAGRVRPRVAPLLKIGAKLLAKAEGKRLQTVVFGNGKPSRGKRKPTVRKRK